MTEIKLDQDLGQEFIDECGVLEPINGSPAGKNLLSIHQLSPDDIYSYIDEAYSAERVRNSSKRGLSILKHASLKAVMRQPSTRTGGSITTAMQKLGGSADLISGMSGSSEAKGESISDSWTAFATQADILGIRTAEDYGPMFAAEAISKAIKHGDIPGPVPVINLGDGRNEHPTQTLGDLFTIHKIFGGLENISTAIVGDHARYRAFHSFLIAAAKTEMDIVTVESEASPVPNYLVKMLGSRLVRTKDLDEAMKGVNVLYIGRNPDEFDGPKDPDAEGYNQFEIERSQQLADDYRRWVVDIERLQQMPANSILMHARPRRNELHPSVDNDPRAVDVAQMYNMIPMRMAIIAGHLGESIKFSVENS